MDSLLSLNLFSEAAHHYHHHHHYCLSSSIPTKRHICNLTSRNFPSVFWGLTCFQMESPTLAIQVSSPHRAWEGGVHRFLYVPSTKLG